MASSVDAYFAFLLPFFLVFFLLARLGVSSAGSVCGFEQGTSPLFRTFSWGKVAKPRGARRCDS